MLADAEGVEIVGEASGAEEALRLTGSLCPDIMLLDIRMPGMNGLRLLRCFGERFVSQSFERFCADPRAAMERVYQALEMSLPELDYSRIRPAAGPYQPKSGEWRRYSRLLELPERR